MKAIITTRDIIYMVVGILMLMATSGRGQDLSAGTSLTQTVRGTLIDVDTREPLIGASVIVLGTSPTLGTITDIQGDFKINSVPVGRVAIQLNYMGYETRTIPNVVVNSGKEVVLNLSMEESLIKMEEVVITAAKNVGDPINEMALVSSRSITTEEMNRLSAGFNDPAIITSNFAGIANSGDGGNDIIVRGNSPKYMQWRLEGMPMTSPNHFNDQAAVTGTTSALNSNLLATSDFHTGAFAPEFGDALSGVYDIKLRNGNNEQQETIVGFGLLGTDLTVEGPFKKGYKGSYLANYRYSTASIFNKLGLLEVDGNPIFQDATFKLHLPTTNMGTFAVYGLGGMSDFSQPDVTPKDWNTPGDGQMSGEYSEDYSKSSYLGNLGITHTLPMSSRGFLETQVAVSADGIEDEVYRKGDVATDRQQSFKSDLQNITYRGQMTYHHKFNARHQLQVGTIYTLEDYNNQQQSLNEDDEMVSIMDLNESLGNLRSYVSWKYKVNDAWTLVGGLHNTNVLFNSKHTLEPRISSHWEIGSKSSLNFGYGMHSTMENVHHYFAKVEQPNGDFIQPNLDLDLLKSHHFVLGYDYRFKPNLLARVEVYYQDLYNLPVANNDTSYFATINEDSDFNYVDLVNQGTGANYGIEFTLQRFFSNNFYWMANASIYESKYTSLEGRERNTRWNGNYLVNLVAGKEFTNLGKKDNQTLALNTRIFFGGGKKILHLLRNDQGDINVNPANNNYWDYEKAYEHDIEDIFQVSVSASYKWDKLKTTHELFLNIDNITGNKGRLTEFYDPNVADKVGYTTQFGLLPNLMYKVYF